MGADLVVLSKFKLQLLALLSESRHLRVSERSAREELHQSNERLKQLEAEYGEKFQEMRVELASRDDLQHKLETKVKYLEHENILLEKKEKELKETVNNLLQSRDSFLGIYESSTYTLRRTIETKDRKISLLSEKIHAHLLQFDAIEKEAASVKQVLDEVQHVVNEKEQTVTQLKVKMDKVATFENDFVEKIHVLENKLNDYQHELRRRNSMIYELKEHLEAQKHKSDVQPQIEGLQKALLVKEEVINTLTSEKQALHLELQNLELSLHKIQDVVADMSTEDQKKQSPVHVNQEVCETVNEEENEGMEAVSQATGEDSQNKTTVGSSAETAAILLHEPHKLGDDSSFKESAPGSCFPKSSDYSPQSVALDPSSRVHDLPCISLHLNTGNSTPLSH